mmetsp:Transcript_19267/g.45003  ORF Transcript_19267/g.45003 Transcript_19267/m.45003 type:complete len:584 (-) Transcript_19267:1818-3569(-)
MSNALTGRDECSLASLETDRERHIVAQELLRHLLVDLYWVGGMMVPGMNDNREWMWVDGTSFSGQFWAANEPNGASQKSKRAGKSFYIAVGVDRSGKTVFFDEENSALLPSVWECCGGCPVTKAVTATPAPTDLPTTQKPSYSAFPSTYPTDTTLPSNSPSLKPNQSPTGSPTFGPTLSPTRTTLPTMSQTPSAPPSMHPTGSPTRSPSPTFTQTPSTVPTGTKPITLLYSLVEMLKDGSCLIDPENEMCVLSHPTAGQEGSTYPNGNVCIFRISLDGIISTDGLFETERNGDLLQIDESIFSGSNGPRDVAVSAGDLITWRANDVDSFAGFRICLWSSTDAEEVLDSSCGSSLFALESKAPSFLDGCVVDGGCIKSHNGAGITNFPEERPHGCVFRVCGAGAASVSFFDTGSSYNSLFITSSGEHYNRTESPPDGLLVNSDDYVLWTKVSSTEAKGFTVCLTPPITVLHSFLDSKEATCMLDPSDSKCILSHRGAMLGQMGLPSQNTCIYRVGLGGTLSVDGFFELSSSGRGFFAVEGSIYANDNAPQNISVVAGDIALSITGVGAEDYDVSDGKELDKPQQ